MAASNSNSLLTCIINVRNGARYIEDTIQSVISQSSPAHLIVIDNQSTDNTFNILRRYPHIELHQTPKTLSLGAARNFGLSKVTTKYVTWLDSDDLWHKEFSDSMTYALENSPIFIAASCGCLKIGTHAEQLPHKFQSWLVREGSEYLTPGESAQQVLCNMNTASPWCSYVFRTESIQLIRGFNENLTFAEDLDLILRLSLIGPLLNVNKNLCYYRVHQGQSTNTSIPDLIYGEYDLILNSSATKQIFSNSPNTIEKLKQINAFKRNWKRTFFYKSPKSLLISLAHLSRPPVFRWTVKRLLKAALRNLQITFP